MGWDSLDILFISGDAYVDHPSFGVALLSRWLFAHGFRVGIVAQPRWQVMEEGVEDIRCMGRPRLFVGITAGAVDSMLAHYTAFRKKRSNDAYTPGGRHGARPNRSCIAYTNLARRAFPGIPIVLGGIEASLRRSSHYDFWGDTLRRPLLRDSKADILVYGMGEKPILAIARTAEKLASGVEEAPYERDVSALCKKASHFFPYSAMPAYNAIPKQSYCEQATLEDSPQKISCYCKAKPAQKITADKGYSLDDRNGSRTEPFERSGLPGAKGRRQERGVDTANPLEGRDCLEAGNTSDGKNATSALATTATRESIPEWVNAASERDCARQKKILDGGAVAVFERKHFSARGEAFERKEIADRGRDSHAPEKTRAQFNENAQYRSKDTAKVESFINRKALTEACREIPGIAWIAPAADAQQWLRRHTAIAPPERYSSDKNSSDPQPYPEKNAGSFEAYGWSAKGKISTKEKEATQTHLQDSALLLPSYEDILQNPTLLMRATLIQEQHVHQGGKYAIQLFDDQALVLTPPAAPMEQEALDRLYALAYTRLPHPSYKEPIPAWEMIRTSITTHRGCAGGCSFCSLALHQGRRITSRSRASILHEAAAIATPSRARRESDKNRGNIPRWAGSISDVGGPSANMWQAECSLPAHKTCKRPSCLHPALCPFFAVDQGLGVRLLRDIAALPGVRHVRIASGVRFDLALQDPEALFAYTAEFTGGQLKVAPEHTEDAVLSLMRKPPLTVFERFLDAFARHCRAAGKEQYTVPYLISAFPGCKDEHMRSLAAWLKARNWSPQQVQCFIPTPGTVATAMFYGGISPQGTPLYVPRSDKDRLHQHHILLNSYHSSAPRPGKDKARHKRVPVKKDKAG